MKIGSVCWLVMLVSVVDGAPTGSDGSSCSRLDFDQAELQALRKCDYMQEFIAKRYNASEHFKPFREEAEHYLSQRWQGLTCGETVATYQFNSETELRMAYNLIFDSGATLEVRVYDWSRLDADDQPTLVEKWRTSVSTNGWGFFREKLKNPVPQARIQIEANINAGSDLAIEYLSIFNYEVETDECEAIDEFATTIATTSSVVTTTTTALPVTSTTPEITTTTTTESTSSTTTSQATTTSTTTHPVTTTTPVITTSSTTTSQATTTSTTTMVSTASSSPSTIPVTTTTNAPRDDPSITPTVTLPSSTTVKPTNGPQPLTTSTSLPEEVVHVSTAPWLWMTLSALFGVFFVVSLSVAIYLCRASQHLERLARRLLNDGQKQQYKH
ncbi:neurofascin-like [Anopheles bellator]|uniref:neurofascin-like n=1 Tax=Anopheles bellator TaxID=139047 RepID=UPI002648C25A|nr:neurofascin-like [Anopheles bellator]